MKRILQLSFLLLLPFIAPSAKATTYTAIDCTQPNVQAAVSKAVAGDTVVIPACTQTNWTATVTVSTCIEIMGKGQGVTVIGDNVPKTGTDKSVTFLFNVSCGSNLFKLHDLTIVGVATDPNIYNRGHVRILGSGTAGFRIYNITGTNMQTSFASTNWVGPGLFDHLTFPNCGGARGSINMKASSWGGGSYGDGSWADSTPLPGSANQIFIEDSTWICSGAAPSQMTDGDSGARWTFRFNTATDGNGGNHGTDTSQRERSGRWQEIYKNSYAFTSNEWPAFIVWFRGGSGMEWGNTISATGFNNLAQATNCRDSNQCGASYIPWGFCNGSGTWDQNSVSSGYMCVDQPGTGTSRMLSGTTPSGGWVQNISEPIYVFMNTGTAPSGGVLTSANVAANRDIYTDLKGATGVRSGLFANMPSTCTTGQFYWATDQGLWNKKTPGVPAGQGYKCTATNTWTLWYVPYTYPHPLQTSSGTPPAAPTGLQAIVN